MSVITNKDRINENNNRINRLIELARQKGLTSNPKQATTEDEMEAMITDKNVGKVVKYLGESGEPLEILPEHRISVRWYDKRNEVASFDFTNLEPYGEGNEQYIDVTMIFDEEKSAKFSAGKYTYCVTYYGEYTTTIAANMNAEVEVCH